MEDNVEKFPISTWQRAFNRRGKRTVNCIVTDRYLRYDKPGRPMAGCFPDNKKVGTPIVISVMTDKYSETKHHKICELVLTLEELKAMVAILDEETNG